MLKNRIPALFLVNALNQSFKPMNVPNRVEPRAGTILPYTQTQRHSFELSGRL